MKIDWQHIVLIALAFAGAVAISVKPATGEYIAPILAAIVPVALAKTSFLLNGGDK